ncbi:carboxypeptidase-like regulatory domain-containing protein [Actinoplanes sp. NBRC 103695]|uniref:carboxypeptidase-like regulatory domain-containing protein n=1 Tax=Actinoplanes sp. NBRC 103695 TaxID=3032202 RepID=UPI0024A11E68|nr:carboxypeptidase-like regulatory domain-containing protein [Actinoplanes sp. NBRC 103695]GLY93871.1 hypothetical protein Acsp02_11270 [Actinoplanes sp. NBRC 103695]
MTTRLGARWAGAAGLIALAGATLAVSATPVAAAPPAIRIESVSSDNVKSGGTVRVRFRVTNNERGTERAFVAVSGGLRCTKGCSATKDLGPGESASFDATVVAPKVSAGEESGLNLAVTVRIGLQTGFAHKMILVRGSEAPSSAVTQVSGRVRDADGKAVGNATVAVRDSAGHSYQATSDGSGKFSIRSSDSKPIAPGSITVAAGKDGYRTARVTARGVAGSAATVRLILAPVATPSTTPPSPTAEASSPVVAEEEPVAEDSLAGVAPPATVKTAGDEGGGLLLATIVGGLLVAAGLGALALVLIRRRKSPVVPVAPVSPGGGRFADAPTALLRTVPPDGRPTR